MYKTLLIGNLGSDATVNQVGEKQVINFNVAVQVKKDMTQWVECAYWRRNDQSVAVAQFMTKGKKVYVKCQCSPDVFQDKPKLKMMVNTIELVGSNERDN